MSNGAGLLYLLGMGQFLVMLCMVLFSPNVSVQLFIFKPKISNGTLTHDPGDTQSIDFSLSGPMLLTALLSAVFVSNTFQLCESGTLTEDQVYSRESLIETGLWNVIFWLFIAYVHFVCILTMDTPVDFYALLSGFFMQLFFLLHICKPNETDTRNFAQSNLYIVGLLLGLVITLFNIPSGDSNRYTIFFVLFLFDYFLCIGHTWDICPRMGTVVNCRLCYACTAPLCLAALYGMWMDRLLFARH